MRNPVHTHTHTHTYIVIQGQTVWLYHNSSVRLDTWDGSKPTLTLRQADDIPLNQTTTEFNFGNLTHIFLYFALLDTEVLGNLTHMYWLWFFIFCAIEYRRAKFVRRAYRVFVNDLRDLGSIPSRVIQKTQIMILDVTLLNTQLYTVRIKCKAEQSTERSSVHPLLRSTRRIQHPHSTG